jgi:hypothetical protein
VEPEVEALVVRLARENSVWGCDRIVGALSNLGHHLSDQTVGNILRRHNIAPTPKRSQTTTWMDFIRRHAILDSHHHTAVQRSILISRAVYSGGGQIFESG